MKMKKRKVIVLGGEERSVCEVIVDGKQFEHVSEFKYLGFVLDELVTVEQNVVRKLRVLSAVV